tara:strand:+ start:10705 stop:10917 length:213 start_codon:yes stop_codon:yes gene_type:complete
MNIKKKLQDAVKAHNYTGVPAALQKACEEIICELSKPVKSTTTKPKEPIDELETLSLPKTTKKKVKAKKT